MLFIVNPVAGNGKTGLRWGGIEERLRMEGLRFDVAFTQEPGHATHLARQAVQTGFRTVIAVGGDGTLNEALNGLHVEGRFDPDVRLGVVPSGTGGDFGRGLDIPHDPLDAALHVLKATSHCIDIGRVRCKCGAGEVVRYFINVAGLGFDGEVADRVNRSSKAVGGTAPYLYHLVTALFAYRNKRVRWTLDGQPRDEMLNSVIVANGAYFAGGMHISPHSKMDDGLFHIITLGNLGKAEFLLATPRVYNGTHLKHPKVKEYAGQVVYVEADSRMFLQAEGELIGEAPATFAIQPGALYVLA
jgi:diacylglycerol kinase (ATP)